MAAQVSTNTAGTALRAVGGEPRRVDSQLPGKSNPEDLDFEVLLPEKSENGVMALSMIVAPHPSRTFSSAVDFSPFAAADQSAPANNLGISERASRTLSSVVDFSELVAAGQGGRSAVVAVCEEPSDTGGATEQEIPFDGCDLYMSIPEQSEATGPVRIGVSDSSSAATPPSSASSGSSPTLQGSDNNSEAQNGSSKESRTTADQLKALTAEPATRRSALATSEIAAVRAAYVPLDAAAQRAENPSTFKATATRTSRPLPDRSDGTPEPHRQFSSLMRAHDVAVPPEKTVATGQITDISDPVASVESREKNETQILSDTKVTVVRNETHLPPVMAGGVGHQIGKAIVAEVGQPSAKLTSGPVLPIVPIVKTLELQLEPRELGPVIVRMSILDMSLRVSLRVKDEKIAAQLGGSQRELAQTLKDSGISLDELVIQAVYTRQDAQVGSTSQSASPSVGSQNGHQSDALQGGTGSHDGSSQRGQSGREGNKSRESQTSQTDYQQGMIRSGVYL